MTPAGSEASLVLLPPGVSGDPAESARSVGVSREAAERVLRYLVFHRSLLGEGEGNDRMLERYLKLVENLKQGVHLVIPDPFQKATALLFELVLDEEFDPWEIDLVRFTQTYVERVQKDHAMDFGVAGRLLCMAWSILYLQSEEILKAREPPPDLPADGAKAFDGPDYLSELTTPESVDLTATILEGSEAVPLEEMVRHSEHRPVSLLELVQAFGEAEEHARRQLKIQELRERLRAEQRAPPEVRVHGDIPEQDLADVWEIARQQPLGKTFPFLAFWRKAEGRDQLVAIFLAALFLARERVLEFRQERLGESPLEVVRCAEMRPPPKEE
jgi:segregation and condensation protein A